MAFNPDEYVNSPVSPDEDEKKKKQEEAAAEKSSKGGFDPDAYLATTPAPEAAPEPRDLSAGDVAAGTYGAVTGFAKEHPIVTGAAALGAAKVLGNVPGVGTAANYIAGKTIPGYTTAKNVAQGLSGAAQAYANNAAASTTNTMMETYKGLQHTASQYVKSGQQVPQGLIDTLKDIESKIVAQHSGATKAAGAVAPEAQAAAQGMRAAAPAAEAGGTMLSRMAPYLQGAGKVAGMAGRVAGPAGLAYSAYEAAPYLQQAQIGERTKSGEVKALVNSATRMALSMPTPAPLSPTEAKNLLDSGDERTIKIYGGRQKLQQMTQPNAIISGFARQLNILG